MKETASELLELSSEMQAHIDAMGLSPDEKSEVEERVRGVLGSDLTHVHTTDIDGRLLGIDIPSSKFEGAVLGGQGIDGSSVKGLGRDVYESDTWMNPDLTTASVDPWPNKNNRKISRVMTTLHNVDGSPVNVSPRNVLIRQLDRAKAMGYKFVVSPELEFSPLYKGGKTKRRRRRTRRGCSR